MTDNAIITAAQNIAIAINNLVKATASTVGTATSASYAAGTTTQVTLGSGRLNNVTIVDTAAVNIDIYNAKSTSAISSDNLLASVSAANLGTVTLNKNYGDGLVVVIGAGASANVTYSPA